MLCNFPSLTVEPNPNISLCLNTYVFTNLSDNPDMLSIESVTPTEITHNDKQVWKLGDFRPCINSVVFVLYISNM